MSEFVWMQHVESAGKQQFPVGAVEEWRVLGWSECDAPVEADPALAEYVPIRRPEPAEEPVALEEDEELTDG